MRKEEKEVKILVSLKEDRTEINVMGVHKDQEMYMHTAACALINTLARIADLPKSVIIGAVIDDLYDR